MKYGGVSSFPAILIHIQQHQHETLGSGERSSQGAGLGAHNANACGSPPLHFNDFGYCTEGGLGWLADHSSASSALARMG